MRTERNVMMAASRSRPECKASERTPKLPVRTTKNVLRETNSRAEPTLKSAARFYSRPSSTWLIAPIARLDYLIFPHSLARAALSRPHFLLRQNPISRLYSFRFIARHLPAKPRRCTFSAGVWRPPNDSARIPFDRFCVSFSELQLCASLRTLVGSQRMECPLLSGDGSGKVCAHGKRRDHPRSGAHHPAG